MAIIAPSVLPVFATLKTTIIPSKALPDSGSSVAPVGMEVSDPLLGSVEPDLVRLVRLVPGPVVLAPGTEGVGGGGLDRGALHPLQLGPHHC